MKTSFSPQSTPDPIQLPDDVRAPARAAPLLAVTLLTLGGCFTAGPDYHAPKTMPPAAWNTDPGTGLAMTNTNLGALAHWWTTFDDPVLTDLIARAQAGNQDVRQAVARVRQARAQRGIARAAELPTIEASGSASRTRSSGQAGNGRLSNLYANGLDASWDADLFGGQRRTLEAATATWQASQEDLRDVLVTLCSEVALRYVDVRAYQTRLSITESNLASQVKTYDITRWRYEAHLVTQLDVDQARLGLEQTRATLPALQTGLDQARHQLAKLLGLEPEALHALLKERRPLPVTAHDIALRLPADVLRQRPDIRRTERQLAAQTAEIGVAAAARYPNFTLSGSIGLEALEAGNLYTLGARTASGAAAAGWTLFDGGKIRQTIAVQTALQEEALALYQATVLTALQEVEDALVAYANEQARRRALTDAAQAAQSAFALARDRYASGLIDFEAVLTTQQSLLAVQDSLASSEATVISDLIRLYRALGGGWTDLPPATATTYRKS